MTTSRLIGDRFFESRGSWIDISTGHSVRLVVENAGSLSRQLTWSSRCSALANLRHPLLDALIDFGALGSRRTFEAYQVRDSRRAAAYDSTLHAHLTRFLAANGIDAAAVPRPGPMPLGARHSRAAIGVVLQPRRAYDALGDALDAAGPPGACEIRVGAPANCGLRTLRSTVARMARMRGYVPVSASLLRDVPDAARVLEGRHLCVLGDCDGETPDGTAALARALTRAASCGGRRHVVLTFSRRPDAPVSLLLEPMGVIAMTAMVYVDSHDGPNPERVMTAIRRANGLPGRLLAELDAAPLAAEWHTVALVRETAPAFGGGADAGARPRRLAGVLLRATDRAERLARSGRHTAAIRILSRAIRVLTARGQLPRAASCALALGRINAARGRVDAAIATLRQARELDPEGPCGAAASIELGRVWLADGRMSEAEGTLRTAEVSARTLGERAAAEDALAALADCLRLQGRVDEGTALDFVRAVESGSALGSAAYASAARLWVARGELSRAIPAARRAVEMARAASDARHGTQAHAALAEALAASGDRAAALTALHHAIHAARTDHLPVEAARLRALQLRIDPAAAPRRGALRLQQRGLPRLVRLELESACAAAGGGRPDREARAWIDSHGSTLTPVAPQGGGALAELEEFLELCRMAADDKAAVEQVCAELHRRLRTLTVLILSGAPEARTLAIAGKPWPGEVLVAQRALAAGVSVAPDHGAEPFRAAEPLRYGGEIIAALACRWAPGVALDTARTAALLRAAALAVSGSVRALLDCREPRATSSSDDLVGESPAARALREAVQRAARAPFAVLIEGESGSGKELVARAIHRLGPRRDRKFCPVNCAALTDDLLEAELFGHARGAFTGAVGERPGLFEDADGGTLFLDEIGELSQRAQAKLLRVLQDGEVRRVGETIARRVDVRVVAATNRRLADETAAGRFRADLRFRLDVVRIDVPPLRDRAGDVPLLAAHFWADAAARVGARATLAPEVLAALARYDWPGNVRELQNVMAWMAVHSPLRGRIGVSALPAHVAHSTAPSRGTFEAARAEFERRFVRAALATANGQRSSAAAALGVSRQGLAKMLRRLGLEGV